MYELHAIDTMYNYTHIGIQKWRREKKKISSHILRRHARLIILKKHENNLSNNKTKLHSST